MSQSNDDPTRDGLKEVASLLKDIGAIVSLLSTTLGPSGTFFLPVVKDYTVTCGTWAFSLSFFALILIHFQYAMSRRRLSCWWAGVPLVLFIGAGVLYAYLLDQLPKTQYPIELPTLTQHTVSVAYGMIFAFLSATLAVLAACRLAKKNGRRHFNIPAKL